MSSVSLPVTRPTGRALLVGSVDCRQALLGLLRGTGYVCIEADDPYSALVELSRNPQDFQAMILSLQSVYREELTVIATVKRRFSQVEIWLTDTDGRQAAMADAMRLGADGLLGDDGLHLVATAAPVDAPPRPTSKRSGRSGRSHRNRRNSAKVEGTARPSGPSLAATPMSKLVLIAPQAPSMSNTDSKGSIDSRQASPPQAGAVQAPAHSSRPHSTNGAAAEQSHFKDHKDSDFSGGDAVLTAEELRALLHEPPGG
jgi:hypothetical protein